MHGDLSHRNIVFKESDYLGYTDKFPLIENFVKSLFSTTVVLFIGYSISDYNLNQILSWIRNRTKDAPPSFSIVAESKIALSESNYLREKGVYTLAIEDSTEYNNEKYIGLSEKSISVAKILENIIFPANIEKESILSEIANDIADWTIIHPYVFVQLIKDKLNITEADKLYYDSALGVISYHLSAGEEKYNRNQYRNFRKSLRQILNYLPVEEIRLLAYTKANAYAKVNSPTKIKNKIAFDFIDEYTTFDFKKINSRVASFNCSSFSDIDNSDKIFQYAFDNYFIQKPNIAKDAFLHAANLYFSKSQYINSLISSFNKKYIYFGEISLEEYLQNGLKTIGEEQLSRNDNISEMIERFPKSIFDRQKALFQDLDASNTFILKRFREIVRVSQELNDETEKINNGGGVVA